MTTPVAAFRFTADPSDALGGINRLKASLSSIDPVLGDAFKRFAPLVAGALSISAITSFTAASFAAADAVGDMASKFGTTAEVMSRLTFAAGQSDVEISSLSVGVKTLQKELSLAAAGGEDAQKKFYQLGISASALRELSLEEQFKQIAQAFRSVTNPADQTRIAMELFGKAGADLVPLLNQGAAGIDQLMRKADELGITLKNSTAASIDAADKALKQFKATASTFTANFLGNILLGFNLVELTEPVDILQRKLFELERRRFALLHTDTLNSDRRFLPGLEEEIDATTRKLTELQRMLNGGSAVASGPESRRFRFAARAPEEAEGLSKSEIATSLKASQQLQELTFMRENVNRLFSQALSAPTLEGAALTAQLEAEQTLSDVRIDGAALYAQLSAEEVDVNRAGLAQQLEDARKHFADKASLTAQDLAVSAQAAAQRQEVEQSVVSAGIGALNAFNAASIKKSKELVAINKAVSIAQAVQNTYVGATKALAQGGVFGFVSAGAIIAFGLAQVAAIARTDYNSIGAANPTTSPGTPANPTFNSPSASAGTSAASAQRSSIQIIVQGNLLTGSETVDWFMDALRDRINNRDSIIINGGSAQAQQLVPA